MTASKLVIATQKGFFQDRLIAEGEKFVVPVGEVSEWWKDTAPDTAVETPKTDAQLLEEEYDRKLAKVAADLQAKFDAQLESALNRMAQATAPVAPVFNDPVPVSDNQGVSDGQDRSAAITTQDNASEPAVLGGSEAPAAPTQGYKDYTAEELRDLLNSRGIKFKAADTKPELIAKLGG